ncbi:MAG: transketolase-like TK C-terminal-containing protein [Steroidobacteraceae bacterium]
MRSWELFERQNRVYRDSVLPPDMRARVSVEAGSVIGWDRYVDIHGAKTGRSTFGSSVPIQALLTEFGFTPHQGLGASRAQIVRFPTQRT